MSVELGWLGWSLVALAWLAAGVGVAWLFGRFVDAGKGGRIGHEMAASVSLYKNRSHAAMSVPDRITPPLSGSAKL